MNHKTGNIRFMNPEHPRDKLTRVKSKNFADNICTFLIGLPIFPQCKLLGVKYQISENWWEFKIC